MKTVVVGGNGWVSRTAISHYLEIESRRSDQVIVYGSKARLSKPISNVCYPIEIWSPKKESFQVETFVPAAFLTLDKFAGITPQQYHYQNTQLIEKACEYIKLNSPNKCILFSSGITLIPENQVRHSDSKVMYRNLKLEEESRIRDVCRKSGTSLVVCRLFNASGRFVTNHEQFALANFLYQGLTQGKVEVRNPSLVWRRYADLSQVFEICDLLVNEHEYISFESGGVLVELHELAHRVSEFLGVPFLGDSVNQDSVECYFSKSSFFEELAVKEGVNLLNLEGQIGETKKGIEEIIYNS